ncbi:DUF305 domain-containing protein [Nocardia farcinica]|uniref:DUF305 domain-containing protein n=1 Tax=Nocardia farcinica (strain IFM 10152) TaxID=247156 RepID=Q5YMI4_NOCFA|nr:DUF305 domain-containing protein [Nocardia farcinica]BAD60607.1 hypothetical protein PNF1_820 [Nocardia farcinica IFM 10152]
MPLRSTTLRRYVPGVAVLLFVLAGCGDSDEAGKPTTTAGASAPATSTTVGAATSAPAATYNDADVTFLQMMYLHHAQAVQMADMVPSHSQNPQMLDLASAVKAAQEPEMAQIRSLLEEFGKPVPSPTAGPMGPMGHDMPGMMSPEQMSSLQGMSGAEFDRMWLQMMIGHHTGAVQMAQTELDTGANDQAKQLAAEIVSAQQREIDQMKAMLGQR